MHLQYGNTETCQSRVNIVSCRCKCIQLVLKWKQWFQHILQSLVLGGMMHQEGERQIHPTVVERWSVELDATHRRGYVDEDRKLNFRNLYPSLQPYLWLWWCGDVCCSSSFIMSDAVFALGAVLGLVWASDMLEYSTILRCTLCHRWMRSSKWQIVLLGVICASMVWGK